MPATDVHQHLWPESLLGLLAARDEAPRLRRGGDGWQLELAGEAPAAFDVRAHDPAARADVAAGDGIDRVLVAPSSPLGIESLPAAEAQPLLDAFHAGVLELGGPFMPWGSLALAAAEPAAVDALLDLGAAGLCLPGAALTTPAKLDAIGPVLERLTQRRAPLFVHPGPAPAGDSRLPEWWPPMTSYVAEMQAAWLAWAAWGRPAHPGLKVVWAMLAGCAPLQVERLAARGGPAERGARRSRLVRRLLVRPARGRRDAARRRRRPARARLRPADRRSAGARLARSCRPPRRVQSQPRPPL